MENWKWIEYYWFILYLWVPISFVFLKLHYGLRYQKCRKWPAFSPLSEVQCMGEIRHYNTHDDIVFKQ